MQLLAMQHINTVGVHSLEFSVLTLTDELCETRFGDKTLKAFGSCDRAIVSKV